MSKPTYKLERTSPIKHNRIWECSFEDLVNTRNIDLAHRFGISTNYVSMVRIKRTGGKFKRGNGKGYSTEPVYDWKLLQSINTIDCEKIEKDLREEEEKRGLAEGRVWYHNMPIENLKPELRDFILNQGRCNG